MMPSEISATAAAGRLSASPIARKAASVVSTGARPRASG
jgi:hypothetical protein